jgi:hypothetical protein
LEKQHGIEFIDASQEIHCSLREFAWSICFSRKDFGPDSLHLFIGDQTAFVEEICDPVILHALRLGLWSDLWQSFVCDRFDVVLLLRFFRKKRTIARRCNSVISIWVTAAIFPASALACATRFICQGLHNPPMASEIFTMRVSTGFAKSPTLISDVDLSMNPAPNHCVHGVGCLVRLARYVPDLHSIALLTT